MVHILKYKGGSGEAKQQYKSFHSPGVDDVPLVASLLVGVEHQVTVTSIELSIGARVHFYFVTCFHTPDLQTTTTVTSAH